MPGGNLSGFGSCRSKEIGIIAFLDHHELTPARRDLEHNLTMVIYVSAIVSYEGMARLGCKAGYP
jgi:hypothetical protein